MSDKHSLEFNKLAAGFLVAGLIAMVASFGASILYTPKEAEKRGFAVEVPEAPVAGAAAVEVVEVPIAELLLTASAENGAKEAKKRCAACHTFDAGGANKTGPNLYGILNSKIAGKEDYPYSSALQEVGNDWNYESIWNYESMNQWLKNPSKFAKGTKMILKLKKDSQRADVIKYLDTLK